MNLENMRSTLIFIIAATILTGGKSQNNFSIPIESIRLSVNYMVPIHYNIKLIPNTHIHDSNKAKPSIIIINHGHVLFDGESSITINILQSTQYIKLHGLNLLISLSIKLFKGDGLMYKMSKFTYGSEPDILVFHFNEILFPGLYCMKVDYVGRMTDDDTEGFFRSSHVNKNGDTENIVATHIQATGARRLFPCWDDPQLRTTFAISVKHHRNFTALSNMPIRMNYTDQDYTDQNYTDHSLKWTHFLTTPPIATYHVAIAVTNYIPIRINKNIYLWCRKYLKDHFFELAKRVIESVTSHLETEFQGIEIPKMDHVAIPNFPQDGTSKCGLIFHREMDLIHDEQLDPVMRKIEVARGVALKIAYQWFGNAISSSRWSFFWLHDGLATIFAEEAVDKILINSGIMDFFIVRNQYESLHLDFYFNMNPPLTNNLSETNSLFNFPRYIKAPIVLRMLQNVMTTEVFRSGVRSYLYKYVHSSLAPYQFWSIQEDLANEYLFNISRYDFSAWINNRHYPILNWTQKNSSYGTMKQCLNKTHYGKWWIPTRIITKSILPNNIRIQIKPQTFSYLDYNFQDDWVMVDIQQAGYYRISYENKNLHQIAHYLNSEEYEHISVINRAKIIDDVFHFMIARQLNISMFWKLTTYLRQETDYVAWYPMIKMFEYVSNVIPFDTNATGFNIMQNLKELLDGLFEILKSENFIPKNDLTICLRQEILKWACTFRHGPCLEMAKRKLLSHFDNPLSIDSPEWKEWIFCKGLLEANISVWNIVTHKWMGDKRYELLPYVTCTRYSSILLEHLPYMFDKWNLTTHKDTAIIRSYINIFHTFVTKHVNNYSILTKILVNLERIKPKNISIILALTDIINHVYSKKHLDKILIYLEQQKYITDEQQIAEIQRKIQIRSSEIKDQINHFQFLV
ncbi:aminopeptidase M1-like [Temnothorax curvispinosus]|uniref:Aminopeptidase n=2 Tax=Temnothorax TaxID=300110 RepID=A0A6J1RDH1_9HYME|nr:aminopeptidase M1-like [Temnothorax curvispinosus]